jgi:hypothetical protein
MTLAATPTRSAESGVGEIHAISAEVLSAAAWWLRGIPRDDEDEEEDDDDKKHGDEDEEDKDDDGEGYSE